MPRLSSRATDPFRRGIAGVALLAAAAVATAALVAPHAVVAAEADAPPAAGTVRVVAGGDVQREAVERVAAMTPRERAASVVMGHLPSTDAAAVAAYRDLDDLGGFILMGANIPATETELRALTSALTSDEAFPILVAIDQEGGDVSRLPWDGFPSATVLKDAPASATREAFAARAALVQRAGITVNFGVVADITPDPSMFIYRRALGTTPLAGAERVGAAVEGESASVVTTLKHFPGHGSAPGDSHGGIPTSDQRKQQWSGGAALPFAAGIAEGAGMLMFGHLAFPAIDAAPATLSAEWHRIARDELGFSGVAITDDLGMLEASGVPAYADPVANAVAALVAGNDMVLSVSYTTPESAGRLVDGIVAAVEDGTLPGERLTEAAVRVAEARLRAAADGRGLVPCADCAPVD